MREFMALAQKYFGKEVLDTLTGFKGKVAGINAYLNGCIQVLVVPKIKKDGTYSEGMWIDEQRLTLRGRPIGLSATAGGPHPSPRGQR